MTDCKDRSIAMTDYLAGELDDAASKELLAHIESCEACRKEFEELKAIWSIAESGLKDAKFESSLAPSNYEAIFAEANKKGEPPKGWRRIIEFRWPTGREWELTASVALISIVAFSFMLLPALNSDREKARRISEASQRNQRSLGAYLKGKANDAFVSISGVSSSFGSSPSGGMSNANVLKPVPPEGISLGEFGAAASAAPAAPAAIPMEAPGAGGGKGIARYGNDAPAKRKAGALQEESAGSADLGALPASMPAVNAPPAVFAARSAKASGEAAASKRQEEAPMHQLAHVDSLMRERKEAEGALSKNAYDKDAIAKIRDVNGKLEKESEELRADASVLNATAQTDWKPSPSALPSSVSEQGSKSEAEPQGKERELAAAESSDSKKTISLAISSKRAKSYVADEAAKADAAPKIKRLEFKLNLKLWDLTTPADASRFLKAKGFEIPEAKIGIDKASNKIFIQVLPDEQERLEKLIEDLKRREDDLGSFKNGIPMQETALKPVSTFSIDVDTASYTLARKLILEGHRPEPDSVRPEEFINYFDYNYKSPEPPAVFSVKLEAAPSPFRSGSYELVVGVQSRKLGPDANKASSFTIFLDSSGSMAQRGRLDLAKSCVGMLLDQMKGGDTLSIVVGGPSPELVLDKVPASARSVIERVLSKVSPGGSTNLESGVVAAYKQALRNYRAGGFNRVIVFTDGIAELGARDSKAILEQVSAARAKGVSNTIVGLGGDGDEKLMERLADDGDGQYIFLDSEEEAKAAFEESFAAKFREVARDVKIQVEFNPESVARYRQVGYQNRQLAKADFRDDKVDAGEVGAGQGVTALYEMKLSTKRDGAEFRQDPVAVVRIRYKLPDTLEVQEREFSIRGSELKAAFEEAPSSFKLACAAAEFAELLRYPDAPGIANPGRIGDVLGQAASGAYVNDMKLMDLRRLVSALH